MVAEGLLDQDENSDADSMWYTDDPEHTWQHDSPSSDRHRQQQQDSLQLQQQQQDAADAQQQAAGEQFLRRLAAAVEQGAQGSPATSQASDTDAAAAYFDDR
jgi:hypothetical protein